MGQEFLEDQQWSCDPTAVANLIDWGGLNTGTDPSMRDHLRFTQDLIRLRWNQPALRGDNVNAFHVDNQNRVIAFHRWLDGTGDDVIVVATLAEATWYNYAIGFPFSGPWFEVFNSDVYDNWVNPVVAGNGGGICDSSEWNGGVCTQRRGLTRGFRGSALRAPRMQQMVQVFMRDGAGGRLAPADFQSLLLQSPSV
jgi:1,4-alpha-glucan branching enzyme